MFVFDVSLHRVLQSSTVLGRPALIRCHHLVLVFEDNFIVWFDSHGQLHNPVECWQTWKDLSNKWCFGKKSTSSRKSCCHVSHRAPAHCSGSHLLVADSHRWRREGRNSEKHFSNQTMKTSVHPESMERGVETHRRVEHLEASSIQEIGAILTSSIPKMSSSSSTDWIQISAW